MLHFKHVVIWKNTNYMHLSPLFSTALFFSVFKWLVSVRMLLYTSYWVFMPVLMPLLSPDTVCAGVGDGDGGGSGHSDEQRCLLRHALHQVHHLLQGADRLAVQRRQDGWCRLLCCGCCYHDIITPTATAAFSKVSCGSQGFTWMWNSWNL